MEKDVKKAPGVEKKTADKPAAKVTPVKEVVKKDASKLKMPTVQELLEVGAQFGHETKRWQPKMQDYIYTTRNNIHIIDVTQTVELIKKAADFLVEAASRGPVIFVGTKNQASGIVKQESVRSGAFFVNQRWAGGLITNFDMVKRSLKRLNALERMFEEGVEGRTKYEVSQMKKEWQRLDRLYSGIKLMETKPTAVVVIDAKFEKAAIREARKVGIPIVGIVDTNTDPDVVDYIIPSNDDAIGAITLITKVLSDAVLEGNEGKGVTHKFKDYAKAEVKVVAAHEEEEKEVESVDAVVSDEPVRESTIKAPVVKATKPKGPSSKGILGRVQEEKEKEEKQKKEKKTKK